MPSFLEMLEARAAESLLCVGLDPRAATPAAAEAECVRLVAATAPFAAAFKPNAAFFEAHGAAGWAALKNVIAAVPAGIPVVLDAKRGDIDTTAAAYATSAFDHLGAHAITLSPYMGPDSVAPFLANRPGRFAFLLCKTSNPGAAELQNLLVAAPSGGAPGAAGGAGAVAEPLFVRVARRVAAGAFGAPSQLGLVVGATDPAAVAAARRAAPAAWLLVPGVGAQGGDLAATMRAGLRDAARGGGGVLVNVSRAVAGAKDPAAAARSFRDAIRNAAAAAAAAAAPQAPAAPLAAPGGVDAVTAAVARALLAANCVKFGKFTLKSGAVSPIYLDLRNLVSRPDVLAAMAAAYAAKLDATGVAYDLLAGLPYAALPIATAVSLHNGRPLIYPRREAKAYGTKAAIEGAYKRGQRVAVIDDLVSDGGTKVEAAAKLKEAGLDVVAIVVLIDREQGAKALLARHGLQFEAVATLSGLLAAWRAAGAIDAARYAEVKAFVAAASAAALKAAAADASKL